MKKVLLIAALSLAIVSASEAQKTKFGLRIGANYSTIHVKDEVDFFSGATDGSETETKYLAGLQIGFQTNIKLSDAFSLQPELHYSQQGDVFEVTWADNPAQDTWGIHSKSTTRMNYLQLPLLAKYSLGGGELSYFVIAGPYGSYLISGKVRNESKYRENGEIRETDQTRKIKVKDTFEHRFDAGLVGGLGLAKNTGLGIFTFDVRYNHGLLDLSESKITKVTNRFFSAGIGFIMGSK